MKKITRFILCLAASCFLFGASYFGTNTNIKTNKAEEETYLNLVEVKEAGRTFDLSFTASVASEEEKLLTTCYFWATFDQNKPGYVDGYSVSVESSPLYGYYHIYLYEFENGSSKDICGGTVNMAFDGSPKNIRMIMDEEKLWVYEGTSPVPVITKNVSMLNKSHTGTKIGFRTAQNNTQLSNVSLKPFTSFPDVYTIKVLLIANSYGEDTNTYVHEIARSYGVNLIIGVMFYPGSSMTEHYYRILSQAKTYQYFKNAGVEKVGACFDDILFDEKWDYVFVNNATSDRYTIGGFRDWPKIFSYCRKWVPNAASGFFNCWTLGKYMEGKQNTSLELLGDSVENQYKAAVQTTYEFVDKYDIDFVVDSMRLFYYMENELHMSDSSKIQTSIYRDETCHLNEVGRYMQGCCFVKTFLGLPLVDSDFMPGGYSFYNYGAESATEPVDEETMENIQVAMDDFFETQLIFDAPLLFKNTPQKPTELNVYSTKTEYKEGEYLDYSAITCEVIYDSGLRKKVKGFTCNITRKLETSDTEVHVFYKGLEGAFKITVRSDKLAYNNGSTNDNDRCIKGPSFDSSYASFAIDGLLDDPCYTQSVKDTAVSFGDDGYGRLFTLSGCRVEGGAYFVCTIECNYNNMSDSLWYKNANIEFRFGETCYRGMPNVQHFFYFNGKGFADPKCSSGLSIALVESKQITSGPKAGMYRTIVEFFAPTSVFAQQDDFYQELRLFIYGWVWDGNSFEGYMNVTSWAHLPTYYYSYLGITKNGLFWY